MAVMTAKAVRHLPVLKCTALMREAGCSSAGIAHDDGGVRLPFHDLDQTEGVTPEN